MLRFLVARTVQIPIVLLGVSVLAFGMLHLSGDPVHYMLGSDATADRSLASIARSTRSLSGS